MIGRLLALAVISLTLASTFIQSAQAQSSFNISLSGTAGVRSVDLGWTQSGSLVGNLRIRYKIGATSTNWSDFTAFTQISGGSSSYRFETSRISGNDWGTEIHFMVSRIYVVSGGGIVVSNPVSATPLPPKVSGLTVALSSSSEEELILSWDSVDDGPADKHYEFRMKTGGGTWGSWADTSSTAASHTVSGLTPRTVYTFQVRAAGGSVAGGGSNEVSAAPGGPAAPTDLTATEGNGEVTLDWTAPFGTIAKFQYRQRIDGSSTWGEWTDGPGNSISYTVSGLVNGTAYNFEVRAVNSLWPGVTSETVTVTPGPPAAPTGLTANYGNQSVTLEWTAPTGTTAAVTKYQFRQKAGGANFGAWSDGPWYGKHL